MNNSLPSSCVDLGDGLFLGPDGKIRKWADVAEAEAVGKEYYRRQLTFEETCSFVDVLATHNEEKRQKWEALSFWGKCAECFFDSTLIILATFAGSVLLHIVKKLVGK